MAAPDIAAARRAAGELVDAGRRSRINWDKEIGLPADPTAELETRFGDMPDAIAALTNQLRPAAEEIAAAEDGYDDERVALEDVRWARAMGEVHMIVKSAAKALHIVSVGTAPPHDHRIPHLLAQPPESVRDAFRLLAGSDVDLDELHVWRVPPPPRHTRPRDRTVNDAPQPAPQQRLHGHCDDTPPAEFEAAFYAAHKTTPTGAGKPNQ